MKRLSLNFHQILCCTVFQQFLPTIFQYYTSFYKVVKNELYPVRELNCGATHLSSNDVLDIYSLFYSQEPTVTAVVLKEKSVMSINNKRKSHDLGENIKFFGRKR